MLNYEITINKTEFLQANPNKDNRFKIKNF